jgi:ammonium transporter, Amt family
MSNLYNNLTALPADVNDMYSMLNGADMTWVMISAILVFIMTPANGYFYGGTVEFKNAMSIIFVCMCTLAVVSIQWFFFGFSLAFSDTASNPIIGDFYYGGFNHLGMKPHPNCPTIPASLFAIYQLMFATVTPALAFGSIAERTRLGPWIVFLFLWTTVIQDCRMAQNAKFFSCLCWNCSWNCRRSRFDKTIPASPSIRQL